MDRAFGILFSLQRGTPRHEQWVVECLKGSWDSIVGEKLAAVCQPAELKNTTLKIKILDPSWLDTVRGMRMEIQDKIFSTTCGTVKTLQFHT